MPLVAVLLWLAAASTVLGADSVPKGAKEALAPVTKMIGTLVAIAIGLGIAICGAVIVWGGIEKTLAGANQDAEHRASRRILRCSSCRPPAAPRGCAGGVPLSRRRHPRHG